MYRVILNRLYALVAGLFLLAACGQSPDEVNPDASASKRSAAVAVLEGDWVMAARSSGVELPLVLRFELPQRPAVANDFPLKLRFESPEAIEGLSVRLELPDGLASVGPAITMKEPRMPAGAKLEHRLSLKAGREGMFELRLRLSIAAGPGKEQAAVYSIPIIVGAS